ncbi:hypothetical protein BZA05DRAFT_432738 [Tricharina praecox]|uniref:uncharacterized protein n=1 Tax=Tricharina praecox TaxID=43433 RepID=UPI00221EA24C|nr:uncharacterized protein BZA05DRAFT_432738 [Tricharina praecox]KAI5858912.1 hypothetical protein BZA05DRAFT_432738 [Tricharina praecox]
MSTTTAGRESSPTPPSASLAPHDLSPCYTRSTIYDPAASAPAPAQPGQSQAPDSRESRSRRTAQARLRRGMLSNSRRVCPMDVERGLNAACDARRKAAEKPCRSYDRRSPPLGTPKKSRAAPPSPSGIARNLYRHVELMARYHKGGPPPSLYRRPWRKDLLTDVPIWALEWMPMPIAPRHSHEEYEDDRIGWYQKYSAQYEDQDQYQDESQGRNVDVDEDADHYEMRYLEQSLLRRDSSGVPT